MKWIGLLVITICCLSNCGKEPGPGEPDVALVSVEPDASPSPTPHTTPSPSAEPDDRPECRDKSDYHDYTGKRRKPPHCYEVT